MSRSCCHLVLFLWPLCRIGNALCRGAEQVICVLHQIKHTILLSVQRPLALVAANAGDTVHQMFILKGLRVPNHLLDAGQPHHGVLAYDRLYPLSAGHGYAPRLISLIVLDMIVV